MNKAMVVNTLISSIGGALVGGAITYLSVKKTFEARADRDIQAVKDRYALLRKDDGTIGTVQEMATLNQHNTLPTKLTAADLAKAQRFVESQGYSTESTTFDTDEERLDALVNATEEVVTAPNTSIFGSSHVTDNTGPELDGRNGTPIDDAPVLEINDNDDNPLKDYPMAQRIAENEPYLISVEEYFNTEEEWDKDSLSYYEGDDTLIDEREKIVDNRDRYVGDIHLNMFGIKSNDPRVVYVRSPQISTDFEIILEEGKAAVRVFGQKDPDEEEKRPPRKMRPSD